MDFGARAPVATKTHVGLRGKKRKIKGERGKKKPLGCSSFYLKSLFANIAAICDADVGEFEVPPCQRWQIIFLWRTLQTISYQATLYLKQFSLPLAEMWRALKSSRAVTHTDPAARLKTLLLPPLCFPLNEGATFIYLFIFWLASVAF